MLLFFVLKDNLHVFFFLFLIGWGFYLNQIFRRTLYFWEKIFTYKKGCYGVGKKQKIRGDGRIKIKIIIFYNSAWKYENIRIWEYDNLAIFPYLHWNLKIYENLAHEILIFSCSILSYKILWLLLKIIKGLCQNSKGFGRNINYFD